MTDTVNNIVDEETPAEPESHNSDSGSSSFYVELLSNWAITLLNEFAPEYAAMVANEDGELDLNKLLEWVAEAHLEEWFSEPTMELAGFFVVDAAGMNWAAAAAQLE